MAKVNTIWVLAAIVFVSLGWAYYMKRKCGTHENMTGFGVTTGLAFNNMYPICRRGNDAEGGSWSGGCSIPHHIII